MSPVSTAITKIQKAAVLLVSLGPEHAAAILSQLDAHQAAQLQQAVTALSSIPNETKRAVLRELRAAAVPVEPSTPRPYLATLTPERAAQLLEGEAPRLIARLLAMISPAHAAAIVACLPAVDRGLVREAQTGTEPPSQMVAQHLEQALRAKAQRSEAEETISGMAACESLLPPVTLPSAPTAMLPPAAPITAISFTTLMALDQGTLRMIAAQVVPSVLGVALRGAEPSLTDRVLRALPMRQRALVRAQLRTQQPVRLREIHDAQAQVCEVASAVLGDLYAPARQEELAHV